MISQHNYTLSEIEMSKYQLHMPKISSLHTCEDGSSDPKHLVSFRCFD